MSKPSCEFLRNPPKYDKTRHGEKRPCSKIFLKPAKIRQNPPRQMAVNRKFSRTRQNTTEPATAALGWPHAPRGILDQGQEESHAERGATLGTLSWLVETELE